jgi:antitoxin component of MazEF toxin-antitoxin module
MEIKVNTYKVRKRGVRGLVISVPTAWAEDIGVNAGDLIDCYRDENGRLIFKPRNGKRNNLTESAVHGIYT